MANTPWRDMHPDQFRKELKAFLADNPPGKPPHGKHERLDWARAWSAKTVEAGVGGPGWPLAYGGMALPFELQVIWQEEMNRVKAPNVPGTGVFLAGPTVIKHGTLEQRERYLRPMLRGDEIWAQAFSEPGAGSDLASLRSTARREGDVYVVNGQKVWNSYADVAQIAFTLVRTGAPDSRAAGISYLLIDMGAPGVTVRPLKDITGAEVFCEIFFDDVRVPVDQLIGRENEGWSIARTTLGHERASNALNQATFYERVLSEVVALVEQRGDLRLPGMSHRLVDLLVRSRVMKITAMRTISGIITKGDPGPGSSVSRLYSTAFEQDLNEFALDLLGPDGIVSHESELAVQKGRWIYGFLRTRASTIGAGTAEIQRNIVSERILGLPRDQLVS